MDGARSIAKLRVAGLEDLACVVDLVRRYHEFEGIQRADVEPRAVLEPMLGGGEAGRIWLVELDGRVIGYAALGFGYSIELGGRDAFVDELFVVEEHRGKGVGGKVLEDLRSEARRLGVRALHLEVARDNERARRLYRRAGFASRDKYHLMTLVL